MKPGRGQIQEGIFQCYNPLCNLLTLSGGVHAALDTDSQYPEDPKGRVRAVAAQQ